MDDASEIVAGVASVIKHLDLNADRTLSRSDLLSYWRRLGEVLLSFSPTPHPHPAPPPIRIFFRSMRPSVSRNLPLSSCAPPNPRMHAEEEGG